MNERFMLAISRLIIGILLEKKGEYNFYDNLVEDDINILHGMILSIEKDL